MSPPPDETSLRGPAEPMSAKQFLEVGREAFRLGNLETGEHSFLAALGAGAEEPECRLYLARIYNLKRDWPRALEQWQWLHQERPGQGEPRLQVGRALHRLGRFADAAAAFAGLLDLEPGHVEAEDSLRNALLEAGRAAFRQEDHDASEAHFLAALRAGAPSGECDLYLARIYNLKRKWPEALERWQRLAHHNPTQLEPQLQVARAQARMGNHAAAVEAYRKVLDLQPQQPEAVQGLAAAHFDGARAAFRNEDYDAAADGFTAALSAGAPATDCHGYLARIATVRRDWPAAVEHWAWLRNRDPTKIEPHLQRARALLYLNQTADAEAGFEAVIALEPDHPEGLQRLREIRGGVQAPVQDIARRDAVNALIEEGRMAFKAEDFALAETSFFRAISAGADEANCRLYLARIYNIEQDWPKSLEQWTWLRDRDPSVLEPQLQVARAQFRLGRLAAAAAGYRAVIDLAPQHDEALLALQQIDGIRQQAQASEGFAPGESWLSLVPTEWRWQLAGDSVEAAVAALEATLGEVGRQAGALGGLLRAYGEADGDLSAHRQLYRVQAEARADEIGRQVKGARRTARRLSIRTTKMLQTFAVATDAPALSLSLDAPSETPASWGRESPLAIAVALCRDSGFRVGLRWLLRVTPVDNRATMLLDFATALREIDTGASIRAYWLAYGVGPTPASALRVAGRLYQAGHLSQAGVLLQKAPPEAVSPMAAEMRSTAFLYRNGIAVPPRAVRSPGSPAGRLAYVASSSLPFQVAGYTLRTHRLLEALAEAGTDTVCFTRPGYPWDRPRICPPGFTREPRSQRVGRIAYVHTPPPDAYREPEHLIEQMSTALEEHFRAYGCDVVQAASNSRNALPALIAARRVGARFIYEVRGLWELTAASRTAGWERTERFAFDRKLEVLVASNADHVLTITEGVGRELVAGGVDPARVSLLPNAVDTDEFQPGPKDARLMLALGFSDDDFVLVYVGSLSVYEGLDDLIVALSVMRREGQPAKLVLAGAGEREKSLHELVDRLGMTEKVLFVGPVPPEETCRYLSLADAVALPRKRFKVAEVVAPLKPYEAMSMAKPVIVTDLAALTEIVVDGERGLVCQPDDPEDLARVLVRLRQDPALGRRLGRAARAWVLRHATWRHAAAIVLRTHGRLLAEAGPADDGPSPRPRETRTGYGG